MEPHARRDPTNDARRFTRRAFVVVGAVAAAGGLWTCTQPPGMQPAPGKGARSPKPVPGGSSKPIDPAEAARTPPAETATGRPAPPTERPKPPAAEPSIRIKTGGLPRGNARVEINGPGLHLWIFEPGSGKPGTVAEGPVEFAWTATGWRVTEAKGTSRARAVAVPAHADLEISALRNEPQRLTVYGSEWPGRVRLVRQPGDAAEPVDIVHEVPMETYLPGVIAKELYNSWGAATHEAQAVAARSYAACEMARWAGRRHYDVLADERSQAWIGATAHRRSLDAYAATRGRVLLYDARVVPAYYSSCCGGARASARDAISSSILHDIPPLAVDRGDSRDCCSWSPTYRWQARFDAESFARTLPAWARNEGLASLFKVDGLRRVDIAARNAAGRPVRFKLRDAKGADYEVTAERLRWALNADPRDPSAMRPAKERVKSAFIEPLLVGREIVVTGRGHGHGVGLCQYGAEAMAKKGAASGSILARYYPGASVERAYA